MRRDKRVSSSNECSYHSNYVFIKEMKRLDHYIFHKIVQ